MALGRGRELENKDTAGGAGGVWGEGDVLGEDDQVVLGLGLGG